MSFSSFFDYLFVKDDYSFKDRDCGNLSIWRILELGKEF